jgi:hypothetical protein
VECRWQFDDRAGKEARLLTFGSSEGQSDGSLT